MNCPATGRWLLSRRRREQHAEVAAPAPPLRGDLFRRVLLGAVTALIVARPLVAGEDPGRLHSPEALSGVVFNVLWLATAVAGAIWMARSRRPFHLGGWVAVGLHVTTALVLLATAVVTCYRHPGWLITWEWATIAMSFLLVRAVAADTDATSDTPGGFISVVMASALSLAVYGLYQALTGVTGLPAPELAPDLPAIAPPDSDFLNQSVPVAAGPYWLCRATFQRPDTLIAVLLLTLPLLFVFGRIGPGLRHRVGLALLLVPLAAIALAFTDFVRGGGLFRVRHGAEAAWRMAAERPWLGVGPGNFDRHAARLQSTDLPYVLGDGGNSYMDLLATSGLFVAVAVAVTFVLIFVHARRALADDPPEPVDEGRDDAPRWEFYLGGVAGLIIGLGLRLADYPAAAAPQSILYAGVGAIVRAVVWCVAFALFEGAAWRAAIRRKAVLAGLALVALVAFVSPSPLFPAVLQPVIVLAALVLVRPASEVIVRHAPVRWVPVPLVFAVAVVYLMLVCVPTFESALDMTEARRAARQFPRIFARAEAAPPGSARTQELNFLKGHLAGPILNRLNDAWHAAPFDIGPALEWVAWYVQYWKLFPEWPHERGLEVTGTLAQRDPVGTGAPIAEFQLRLLYLRLDKRHFTPRPGARVDSTQLAREVGEWRESHIRECAALIARIVERDPALEARLRFRYAQALMSPDVQRYKEAEVEAQAAWRLEENAPGPRWRLTREQRWLVRRWLKLPPENSERDLWILIPVSPGPLGGGWGRLPVTLPAR